MVKVNRQITQNLELNFVQFFLLTKTKEHDIIGGPGADALGRNFHYTMPRPICQAKSRKKLHKLFFPKLCNLPIAICFWMCYNTYVGKG